MSRLIDAFKLTDYANNTKDKTIDANDIMRFPSVDAVPVVRCKDCKYLYNDDDNDDDCPLRDYFWHNEEDYCSYGERREDDGHNNS